MSDFAPEKILDALSEHQVEFVVIGGFAAALMLSLEAVVLGSELGRPWKPRSW